jgi:hypothetical protein
MELADEQVWGNHRKGLEISLSNVHNLGRVVGLTFLYNREIVTDYALPNSAG